MTRHRNVISDTAMAADLTPRFRRLNSQTRFKANKQTSGFSGPFQATQLWQNMIEALQTQVELRSRRQFLRSHQDCFTGADAVDVVLSHLMQNIYFCSSAVSRLKAARLCQAFMESRVFEPVGTKLFRREKETSFEDSSCSFYRFLEGIDVKCIERRYCAGNENQTPDQHGGKRKSLSRLGEMQTICNPLVLGTSERRVERLLKNINLHPTVPPDASPAAASNGFLRKNVVRQVWRQQALLQLLQLLDIPILDGLLSSPAKAPASSRRSLRPRGDLVISNTCLDRKVSETLNLPRLDPWLLAATDCLELFPDQIVMCASEQILHSTSSVEKNKRLLFDTIARYYSSAELAPLLPGRYAQVLTGILHLLDGGKDGEAVAAARLCVQLLDVTSRDELSRLLRFMLVAAEKDAFSLHKQTENRALVSRVFVKAVIQSKELSRADSERLMLFLMDHCTQLFTAPQELVEAVRNNLLRFQHSREPENLSLVRFCQQVSLRQYEQSREQATLESLKQLVRHVAGCDSLSGRQKRRLARLFQKHHPAAFLHTAGDREPWIV